MKKFYLCLLMGTLVLNGCSVLSKSQIKNINVFAASAKRYSSFPGEIIRQRADLVLEEKLLGSIQLLPDQIKKSIGEAQKNYDQQLLMAGKFDVSLQLIRQYSSLLSKLSSGEFVEDLSANTDDLNDNIDNLVEIVNAKLENKIPANVGAAITKAIFLAGERMTKSRQAKEIKEFISVGDTLIKITVANLVDVLSTDLSALLAGDKEKYIKTYTNFVLGDPNKIDYNSLKQYQVALNDYDNLEELRKLCIKAADKLSIAHSTLNANIQAKKDFDEIFNETEELIISINELYNTYRKLSSNKKSQK